MKYLCHEILFVNFIEAEAYVGYTRQILKDSTIGHFKSCTPASEIFNFQRC